MAKAGKNSAIKIGANAVQGLNSGNITLNNETLDATVFDSEGKRKRLYGLQDATGSVSGFLEVGDTTGQNALRTAALDQTVVENFTILADKTDATSGYKFNALISSLDIGTEVAGLVSISFNFESDGAIAVAS